MRLTQMDAILIRMLYLAAAGIVVGTVLGVEQLSSVLFGLTFILVVLLWCAGALRRVTWTDAILLLTVGLTLGNLVINAALEGTRIEVAYFKKFAMFVSTLVFFQAANKLHIDAKTEKFLLAVNTALAVFFVAIFAVQLPTLYMIRGRVSNYLTFNFTNPNLTALFLLCVYTGEMIQVFRRKSVFGKLLHLLLAAAVCWFVWETESRNCLLTIGLVTALCLLLYATKNGFRLPKWFSLLVAVWPIVFVVAYVEFVENQQIQKLFSFLVDEGKGLDARLSVWLPALHDYGQSPIWGAYSQISRGTGVSQMHNTHLDILVSYGTAILALVCWMLYRVIRGENSGTGKADTMARICFAGTIIMGMGEAALFSGGLGIYLFAGMFLLLCNREQETIEKKQ